MSNEITIKNGNSSMLVPTNIEQAMKLAEMMSGAKLVPAHLQGKPSDCLLVIEQAARWKMSPFAVAQCTSVISGKLMYEGKLVAAVVNANGGLQERLSFDYEGNGESRKIVVSGKFKDEKDARTVEVMFKDVKTANSMWQKQPDQQLMYSGTRAWARRHAPELMLGVYAPEEFDQPAMMDITPSETDHSKPKSPFKKAVDRNMFHKNVKESFGSARTTDDLTQLMGLNKARFEEMKASGAEADHLSLDDLRQAYALAWNRLVKEAEIPEEDLDDRAPYPGDDVIPPFLADTSIADGIKF